MRKIMQVPDEIWFDIVSFVSACRYIGGDGVNECRQDSKELLQRMASLVPSDE